LEVEEQVNGKRNGSAGGQQGTKPQLEERGFKQLKKAPSLLHHAGKRLLWLVHADDFSCSGPAALNKAMIH
jgi:hypothetical protein